MITLKNIKNLMLSSALMALSVAKSTPQQSITKNITLTVPKKSPISRPLHESASSRQHVPRITVWVHGTRTMGPLSQFIHASPLGMRLVSDLPSVYRVRKAPKALARIDSEHFPLEHFYAFGWSGALGFEQRKEEACNLYAALKKIGC